MDEQTSEKLELERKNNEKWISLQIFTFIRLNVQHTLLYNVHRTGSMLSCKLYTLLFSIVGIPSFFGALWAMVSYKIQKTSKCCRTIIPANTRNLCSSLCSNRRVFRSLEPLGMHFFFRLAISEIALQKVFFRIYTYCIMMRMLFSFWELVCQWQESSWMHKEICSITIWCGCGWVYKLHSIVACTLYSMCVVCTIHCAFDAFCVPFFFSILHCTKILL